ncbi:hypothetical protein Tco_1024633 [Tanacetum coccineum]
MLAPPVVEGEDSGQPSEPQPAPSTAQPRIEEQIHTNVPILNVADEAVFKEWDDRVVRATTTAASLDAAQASGDRPRCQEAIGGVIALTRSERASKHSYDSPLLGGNTPKSDEERIKQDDLTDFVPPTPYDSPLSGGHTPGSDEDCLRFSDQKAKKEGQKIRKEAKGKNSRDETLQDCDFAELENVEVDAETHGRNTAEQTTTAGDTVNTASIDVSVVGPSNVSTVDPSTSTAGDIFEDEMMTIADTLVAIRSTRPRTTSVIIHDVEEEPRRSTPAPTAQPSSKDKGKALMVEPEKPSKNPRKAQIQMDEELAIRLHEEEKAELERMQRERAIQEEASNAALIAEFDNVQARMEADALLAARLQEKEREQFSIDEQARFLVETIAERKRFFAAQRAEQIRNKPPTKIQLRNKMITYLKNMGRFTYNQLKNKKGEKKAASSSSKEQSAEKEKELSEEELQKLLVVFPVEEVYVEALQVKYPIINWEVYSEDTRRDDLVKLWDLVKKRFSKTKPTDDKEKELWVELKRLFEPDNDDIIWKL